VDGQIVKVANFVAKAMQRDLQAWKSYSDGRWLFVCFSVHTKNTGNPAFSNVSSITKENAVIAAT
jgi:hypothetical protein